MSEHENVYKNEAERYHALVSFEDYRNNLAQVIRQMVLPGYSILETGAGTGRITKILFPYSVDLVSFDASHPMVSYANRHSNTNQHRFRGYACADHRFLPVTSAQYDWVISGWSVCYLATWQSANWEKAVNLALEEFLRVLRPDGHIILIETLGTGKTTPEPPPHMTGYLDLLEKKGFSRQWVSTDYCFPDMDTARDLTEFFFGPEMVDRIEKSEKPVLPECTGIWTCPAALLRQNLRRRNPSQ